MSPQCLVTAWLLGDSRRFRMPTAGAGVESSALFKPHGTHMGLMFVGGPPCRVERSDVALHSLRNRLNVRNSNQLVHIRHRHKAERSMPTDLPTDTREGWGEFVPATPPAS